MTPTLAGPARVMYPEEVYRLLDLPARRDRYGQLTSYKPDELSFMDDGACRDYDPGLFDTDTNKGRTARRGMVAVGSTTMKKKAQIDLAKSVCRLCPVLSECRAYITVYPEDEGIWAATLPEERRAA